MANITIRGRFLRRGGFPLLIGLLFLSLSTEVKAAQPWESDAIGSQAYDAYQGIDANGALDEYLGESNDQGLLAWRESYALMGFVAMYEGTKDTAHLDRLITHFDAALAIRDDQLGITDAYRNRVMPAWSCSKYTYGHNLAWIVHAGMITDPAARFVYLVNSTPSLQAQYSAKAQQYETAIKQTVDAFDGEWVGNANEGYYENVAKGSIASPYNMQSALGRTMLNLWLATGETKYRDKVEGLANCFKNALVSVNDHYEWKYAPYEGQMEDISHAAIEVDFAFQCYQAGIVFDKTDMDKFINTLEFTYDENTDLFSKYVSGGGVDADFSRTAGLWGHLGYLDNDLRQLLSDWYGEYPDPRWQSVSVQCALAAAYLVETSPVPEPGTIGLLVTAGLAFLLVRRRKFWNK